MKRAIASEQNEHPGGVPCVKNSHDFVQDTIFRIGRLRDHAEKAGMQIASAMPRSLFMQKDKSGGNHV